jgi:lysozyme family protein
MPQDTQNYDPVFLQAVARVLTDEGGFVCNPADPGGETNFGISKRSYPSLDIKSLTRDQAIEIYWNDFWQKSGFYRLKGDVAIKVFDLAVVMGAAQAVTCLQRALRAVFIPHPHTWDLEHEEINDAGDRIIELASFRRLVEVF